MKAPNQFKEEHDTWLFIPKQHVTLPRFIELRARFNARISVHKDSVAIRVPFLRCECGKAFLLEPAEHILIKDSLESGRTTPIWGKRGSWGGEWLIDPDEAK